MDWDKNEFGVDWGEKAEKLKVPFIPKIQKHQYMSYHGLGDVPFHRKERIKLFWPDYQWHRWADRRMKADSERNWLTWIGPASCVRGDTRIFNPITGKHPTIQELYETGSSPIVMTLFGPRKASIPFIKGYDELLSVKLANGCSFYATSEHRVLTRDGFCALSEVSIGDVLAVAEPSVFRLEQGDYEQTLGFLNDRHQSILDNVPSVPSSNVHGFRKIIANSMENCSACFYPYDEQLHLNQDNAQSFAPSLNDVLEYKAYASERSGDSDNESPDNRLCLQLCRPSSFRFFPQDSQLSEQRSQYYVSKSLVRGACEFLSSDQFRSRSFLHSTFGESNLDAQSIGLFYDSYVRLELDQSYGIKVSESKVVSITRDKTDLFYDLEVPNAGHYFAEGVIHHNSGKTVDGAVQDLEWWLQAPHESAVILCSTTMKMLKKRIWAAIAHYHQALPKKIGNVGELLDSVTMIRWKAGDDLHAIFGIAVEEGPIEEVINNLLGIKAKRVRLRIDEGQGIREAILKATTNMSKNPIFQFRMMGNPENIHNPLIRESEPLDGWESVVRGETEEWETLGGPVVGRGLCQFFDGRKSPADDSEEERKRLPFLINKDHIAAHLKSVRGNLNDPSFWSQCIGWPPPTGLENTLLDDAIIISFHCKDKAIWTQGFEKFATLDPAFTGGDKKILQFGKFGQTVNDKGKTLWTIEFGEWMQVPIDTKSERTLEYQMVDFCKVECIKCGIRPRNFSCASAGAGGPLCSIFDQEWGTINRIQEGGLPDEKHVIDETGKTAREAYDTRASELLFTFREFSMSDCIRGLSNESAFQACSRRTFYRNGKWCAEPKVGSKGRTDEKGRPVKGYKERMGHSPDNLDACCLGTEYCRQQGATPSIDIPPSQSEPDRRYEDEFSEENYLKPYSYVA